MYSLIVALHEIKRPLVTKDRKALLAARDVLMK
jgi:hypothetical protein